MRMDYYYARDGAPQSSALKLLKQLVPELENVSALNNKVKNQKAYLRYAYKEVPEDEVNGIGNRNISNQIESLKKELQDQTHG